MIDTVTATSVVETNKSAATASPAVTAAAAAFAATLADSTGGTDTAAAEATAGAGAALVSAATATAATAEASAAAASEKDLLLPVDTIKARLDAGGSHRFTPTLKEFIDKTGADVATAIDLVSGVIGAQEDPRDWTAIFAASDPLAAAKRATGQMLNSTDVIKANREILDARGYKPIEAGQILAVSGNFAVVKQETPSTGKRIYSLQLADGAGQPTGREIGWDADSIKKIASDYDLKLKPLADLADKLDKLGIRYMPFELYADTGSDLGVDLRELAQQAKA